MRFLKWVSILVPSILFLLLVAGAGYYFLPQTISAILLPSELTIKNSLFTIDNSPSPTPTPFQAQTFTPTITPTPTNTATPTSTSTSTSTNTLTPTNTPTPTETPTPTATSLIPAEAYISGFYGFPQTYNLSCESRSASDLARYFGVEFSEAAFLWALPASDNPTKGFVGSATDPLGGLPPNGYGVHAPPVAELMRAWGLPATAHFGMSLEGLQEEIATGRPVMIWAIRDLSYSTPIDYSSSDGATTIVARYEHTFIVIGYGPDHVTVEDNGLVYTVSLDQFMTSWGVLGYMAITIEG
jgi:uncharacterized protein YvpB